MSREKCQGQGHHWETACCVQRARSLGFSTEGKMDLTLMLRTGDGSTLSFKGDQEGKQVLCRRTHQKHQNTLRKSLGRQCLRKRVRSVLTCVWWVRPTSEGLAGQASTPLPLQHAFSPLQTPSTSYTFQAVHWYLHEKTPLWCLWLIRSFRELNELLWKNLFLKWQSVMLPWFALSCQVFCCWSGRKRSFVS